jgi:hypothetical protein
MREYFLKPRRLFLFGDLYIVQFSSARSFMVRSRCSLPFQSIYMLMDVLTRLL